MHNGGSIVFTLITFLLITNTKTKKKACMISTNNWLQPTLVMDLDPLSSDDDEPYS